MQYRLRGPASDLARLVLGAFLVLAPTIFHWTSFGPETWNDRTFGVLLVALAIFSMVDYSEWQGWASLVLGLWILVSAWVLGYGAEISVIGVHVAVGTIVALLAAIELRYLHPRQVNNSIQ